MEVVSETGAVTLMKLLTPEESRQMKERYQKVKAEKKKEEEAYRLKHQITVKVGDNMVYDDYEQGEHQVLKVVTKAGLVGKKKFQIVLSDVNPFGETEYGKVVLNYTESDGVFHVKGREQEATAFPI